MERNNKNQLFTNHQNTNVMSHEQKIRKRIKKRKKNNAILNKIAKNEATGNVDNRDKADEKKYSAVVVDEFVKGKCRSAYEEPIIQQRALANNLPVKLPTIIKDFNIALNKSSPGNEKNEATNIREDKNEVKFGSIYKQPQISGITNRATYSIPATSNVSTTTGTRTTTENQINVCNDAKRRLRPSSGCIEAKLDSTNIRSTYKSSSTAITKADVPSTASWFMDTEKNQQRKSKETTMQNQTYADTAFTEYIEAKSIKVEEIDIPADDIRTFYPTTSANQINVCKVAKRSRRKRRKQRLSSRYIEAKLYSTNIRPTDQSSSTAITTADLPSTASWFIDTERNQQQQQKSKETIIQKQTYADTAFIKYIEAKSVKVKEIDIPADDVRTFSSLQVEEIDGALLKSQQNFEELELVLIDEITENSSRVVENWTSIETRLTELIVEYALNCKNGRMPSFDSAKFRLGFRIIKCDNQFSKDFLYDCVDRISDEWPNIKLKLSPFKNISKTRSKVRIYLPVMKIAGEKILSLLRRQNPDVPISDWLLLKVEKPHPSSMSLLLTITDKSLIPLRNVDYKLKFGIRNATVKVLPSTNSEEDLDIVDERCD